MDWIILGVYMELSSFYYKKHEGWSVKTFPTFDSPNTLILVFAAPEFIDDRDPIIELAKAYPQSIIIGCSTAGEILGPHILDNSLSVAVAKFTKTKIKAIKSDVDNIDTSYEVGEEIANKLVAEDLRGIFILSDGLHINGSQLVKGLNTIQNGKITITGGLAGDGSRFQETWSIYQGEIFKNKVIGVGFYGDHVQISHGSRGGWDIFGPERRITRSKKNVLFELDGKPALALYKEYLGERASGLPATGLLYPLAIRMNNASDVQLVRTILAVDEADQSLTFAGDMPIGYLAQLMRANFDRLITAADEAGELAKKRINSKGKKDQPVLEIAISCVGRRLLLGERTEEETESTLESMPPGTQQVGFYSYGELSPYNEGGCELHNQTMTLTLVTED